MYQHLVFIVMTMYHGNWHCLATNSAEPEITWDTIRIWQPLCFAPPPPLPFTLTCSTMLDLHTLWHAHSAQSHNVFLRPRLPWCSALMALVSKACNSESPNVEMLTLLQFCWLGYWQQSLHSIHRANFIWSVMQGRGSIRTQFGGSQKGTTNEGVNAVKQS